LKLNNPAPVPVTSWGVNVNEAVLKRVGPWYWQLIRKSQTSSRGLKRVRDAAGTILLVEQPNGQGAVGNEWPSISLGPQGTGSLYQIDPAAPTQDPAGGGVNQGAMTYKSHGQRFNYLFHDGHIQTLRTTETIGTGTLTASRGMWTIAPGD
jgi:prepilin-type processing-associated H-X9-DG protein